MYICCGPIVFELTMLQRPGRINKKRLNAKKKTPKNPYTMSYAFAGTISLCEYLNAIQM